MRKTVAALGAAWAVTAAAAQSPSGARELADLPLEQLANVVVTSVSRRPEPLAGAPASVYVITADDIRRSGATSIPEALRLAPNLQAARVDANQWAISARGFNATLANKLLVLIDGRTVFTPLFSGTFWEAQDVVLDDVDRIEVISGPGTTLWGANAVNGVINILTRPARETQGALFAGGAGNTDRQVIARHGATLANGGHYRLYAKNARRAPTELATGIGLQDEGEHTQVGFRADWPRGAEGFTLQGDLYTAQSDMVPQPRDYSGYNLLGRWSRELGNGAQLRVQAYLDHTRRRQPTPPAPTRFRDELTTLDLEAQHALRPAGRHRLMWGFGLRQLRDRTSSTATIAFMPEELDLRRNNVFVQDDITLAPGFELTLGAKIDENNYTGAELLPNARLAWRPGPTRLVWLAASRAVRAPSRVDRDLFTPATPPFTILGGDFHSEVAEVLELGYRGQPSSRLAYSATLFHADYSELRSLRPTPAGSVIANDRAGRVSGIEAWASWRAADWWRLSGGFTRLQSRFGVRGGAVDVLNPAADGADPNSWWKLRAAFDLGEASELDVMARHHGALDTRPVPAYTAIDLRYGWHAARRVELSVLLQNVLDRGHAEWSPGADFGRGAFVKLKVML